MINFDLLDSKIVADNILGFLFFFYFSKKMGLTFYVPPGDYLHEMSNLIINNFVVS